MSKSFAMGMQLAEILNYAVRGDFCTDSEADEIQRVFDRGLDEDGD